MLCPIRSEVKADEDGPPESCRNCISELADRVFRSRIMGGEIETPPNWCDDVRQIGEHIEKLKRKKK